MRASPNGGRRHRRCRVHASACLFSFLERFLQREGFGTKFLFDSPSGEDMLYELSEDSALRSSLYPAAQLRPTTASRTPR